ncbi:hypothetical protein GDO86_007161 [Hymenochirus boettgeri]|uniref:tRNA (34-2'-O)-methyltransferase regulator WDR6 n=1 Tax=Hymenochirus boettgeri TaxID=247094 RepID=A0A8T2J0P3_9PIPI|nr:hypothetical protein GDO86_007161 [Hymenochirus boettgeri]
MESVLLTAPITALEFVDDHLLSGEGPYITVYCVGKNHIKIQRKRQNVLKSYTVHGIKLPGSSSGTFEHRLIAVFGGKGLIVLQVTIDELEVGLIEICKLRELHDWIWDVQWLGDDLQSNSYLALALGHNSVALYDYRTGKALKELHCAEKCILYSACFYGKTWEELILVSGTVFNQLVIWATSDPTNEEGRTEPRKRISGHNGVIFSIFYDYKKGLLASASDDRSLRVWDVGDLASFTFEVQCRLVLYGHQARVWAVKLLPDYIISIGEDSACIVWNYQGKIVHTFKGHKGRGIRAVAVQDQHHWVATGGVDSGIRLWQINNTSRTNELLTLNFSLLHGPGVPKAIAMVDANLLVVMTDLGSIYTYDFICKQWTFILEDENYKSYSLLDVYKMSASVLCAIGNIKGGIKIFMLSLPPVLKDIKLHLGKIHSLTWVPPVGRGQNTCSLFSSGPSGVMVWLEVTCVSGHMESVTEKGQFVLPVCKQRWHTSVAFIPSEDLFVCGDRRGSIMLFSTNLGTASSGQSNIEGACDAETENTLKENREPLISQERDSNLAHSHLCTVNPVSLLFGVHGKLGVTSISCHGGFAYSTGRDGYFRQLSVERGQLTVLRKQKSCKGMEWIERLFFTSDGNLIVMGFHATDFVVWNSRTNEKLHCIPCGGGHRSWSYKEDGHNEVFVYIKSGAILAKVSHPLGIIKNVVKEPMHGRECTCVQYAGTLVTHGNDILHVLLTSSEDTTVNILCFNESTGCLWQLGSISDHLSSVKTLALAKTSSLLQEDCGLSAVLISAGGRAQIECYRVQVSQDKDSGSVSSQVIHLVSHRLDEHWDRIKNKHKIVKMDPETRYMSVAVVREGTRDIPRLNAQQVVLAAACSDGSIRFFLICENSRKMFLVAESFYHLRCVLRVRTLVHSSAGRERYLLCSAATDGRIAFWDITDTTEQVCNISEEELGNCRALDLGHPCLIVTAHQCGINSLCVQENKDGHYLVASGGDDNSIHICCVAIDRTCGGDQRTNFHLLQEISVPSAHAAHVTGLNFLREDLLASVSVDQRLTLWHLRDSDLSHVSTKFCHVADVSELHCWKATREDGHFCVLCGQGLEIVICLMNQTPEP